MATVTFSSVLGNVSADVTSAEIIDTTAYTVPARNSLAVVIFLFKRDSQSNDTAISVDNSQPLTATFWSFSLPQQDGNFVSFFMGVPIWSAGTYAQNKAVYYNGSYYYVHVASTSQTPGGSDWTLITDLLATIPTLGSPDTSGVSQTQTYNFSDAHASSGPLGDALADLGPQIKDGKCKNWNQASKVLTGGALIESAWANFKRADYVNAQEVIDFVDAQTALTI